MTPVPVRLMRSLLAASLAGLAVAPAAAFAHDAAEPTGGRAQEAALLRAETQVLGAAHAREHAFARRAAAAQDARLARLSPAERRAQTARRRARAVAAQSRSGPADQVGRWQRRLRPLRAYGMHAALMPTGEVLFYSWPTINRSGPRKGRRDNTSLSVLWDPRTGRQTAVPAPRVRRDGRPGTRPAPLYCTGETLLADGQLLVAGGNWAYPDDFEEGYTNFAGAPISFTFDPFTRRWAQQPNLSDGHWYPSQALLPDGRAALLGGYDQDKPGAHYTTEFEVFTPGPARGSRGAWQRFPGLDRRTGTYPHLFSIPTGELLLAGPEKDDLARAPASALDPVAPTGGWVDGPGVRGGEGAFTTPNRFGGNSVLLPQGPEGSSTVMQIGGYDDHRRSGLYPALRTTVTVDGAAISRSAGWRPGPSLNVARTYANTVLLPDGGLVTVGGSNGSDQRPEGTGLGNYWFAKGKKAASRRPEVLAPGASAWKLGPPQQEHRTYHSTALLLPDGRVLSAGDDRYPNGFLRPRRGQALDTAEIYSPPYLFDGDRAAPRPAISRAPGNVQWGERFAIAATPAAGRAVTRAVLVAPSVTTHGAEMSKLVIPLAV